MHLFSLAEPMAPNAPVCTRFTASCSVVLLIPMFALVRVRRMDGDDEMPAAFEPSHRLLRTWLRTRMQMICRPRGPMSDAE